MPTTTGATPVAVTDRRLVARSPAPLDQRSTIEDLLRSFKRQGVPIRKTFVQQGKGKDTVPGPLAEFLTHRDERALDAYLLIHAFASSEPWNCDFPSGFWVRALGMADGREIDAGRAAVSKVMKRIADRGLIKRQRVKRMASLTLLKEDGTEDPYVHPREADEQWLHLPHSYWFEGYFSTLSLRAKVMLLIALERPDGFYLPQKKAKDWYGVSADTADRGLRELRDLNLLLVDEKWVKTTRSDTGWTARMTYTLTGPFSSAERRKAGDAYKESLKTEEILESS